MVEHSPNKGNGQQDSANDARGHVFNAVTNLVLFFLKAILVLNSGALVSILLAISNSNDPNI